MCAANGLIRAQKEDSSDDEIGLHTRSYLRGRNGEGHARPEELDSSNLNKGEASKKFRKAERSELPYYMSQKGIC